MAGLAGAAAWPIAARAQEPERVRRIGFLSPQSLSSAAPVLTALREGLRDHGWIEGRTLHLKRVMPTVRSTSSLNSAWTSSAMTWI
jgi:putative ABC transport system substrate-binding protein